MASIIVIEYASERFGAAAAALLLEHGYREVSDGTFVGDESAEPLVELLKSLDSYSSGVELYHGFVSKT